MYYKSYNLRDLLVTYSNFLFFNLYETELKCKTYYNFIQVANTLDIMQIKN